MGLGDSSDDKLPEDSESTIIEGSPLTFFVTILNDDWGLRKLSIAFDWFICPLFTLGGEVLPIDPPDT